MSTVGCDAATRDRGGSRAGILFTLEGLGRPGRGRTGRGPALAVRSPRCHLRRGIGALLLRWRYLIQGAVGSGRLMQHRRTPAPPGRQRRDAAIGQTVRDALKQKRLLFAFQPVVCASSGQVDYFECLLRMRENDRLVACGEFIAAIEQVGLIGLIDRFVLERTFAELAAHPEIRLGFNVSGQTAGDRPWLRSLMALLRQRPELAHRLVVEITETAALEDLDELARFVETLRHAGCRVALDDFGAGHTSLRHLQVLAIDTIKIDGSFVRSLAECRENQVILRHLLGLTRGFGLSTVAECVETAQEAALLREAGVGYLQGYHFGRPTIEPPWRIGAGRMAPEIAAPPAPQACE